MTAYIESGEERKTVAVAHSLVKTSAILVDAMPPDHHRLCRGIHAVVDGEVSSWMA